VKYPKGYYKATDGRIFILRREVFLLDEENETEIVTSYALEGFKADNSLRFGNFAAKDSYIDTLEYLGETVFMFMTNKRIVQALVDEYPFGGEDTKQKIIINLLRRYLSKRRKIDPYYLLSTFSNKPFKGDRGETYEFYIHNDEYVYVKIDDTDRWSTPRSFQIKLNYLWDDSSWLEEAKQEVLDTHQDAFEEAKEKLDTAKTDYEWALKCFNDAKERHEKVCLKFKETEDERLARTD